MGDHLDVAALRADTPGCDHVVHFNNAGAGLMPGAVVTAMVDHLRLEARIGGYEAAAARSGEVRSFYTEVAALINGAPESIAFAGSATQAYGAALSAIPFEAGDVILTTRNDYVSNQIAFLSLVRRFGVRLVHAPEGGVDVAAMAGLMRSHRPRLVAVWLRSAHGHLPQVPPRAAWLGVSLCLRPDPRRRLRAPVHRRARRGVDALAALLRERLAAIPGGRVLDRGPSLSAIVTFTIDGWEAKAITAALDARGINTHTSSRNVAVFDLGDQDVDWAVRLSPHYYNTEEEVDRSPPRSPGGDVVGWGAGARLPGRVALAGDGWVGGWVYRSQDGEGHRGWAAVPGLRFQRGAVRQR